jgi:hypothetical protein
MLMPLGFVLAKQFDNSDLHFLNMQKIKYIYNVMYFIKIYKS